MNKTLEQFIKGLGLAVVFGGACYLLSKDVGMSGLIALVMFMSMFVKPKQK